MAGKVNEEDMVFHEGMFVEIPINRGGNVILNRQIIADALNCWRSENPTKKVVNYQIHLTPSSSGRGISVNCITIFLE